MKRINAIRDSSFLSLIVIGLVLWLALLIWPSLTQPKPITQSPTHYVIVVRNTHLKIPNAGVTLMANSDFHQGLDALPNALAAAKGVIPLWRPPLPGDFISVVFAAAGKPSVTVGRRGCDSHHFPEPADPGQKIPLQLGTFFDVRDRFAVKGAGSTSNSAVPSSGLHRRLTRSLARTDCDLIAQGYSEGLTLATVLSRGAVHGRVEDQAHEQYFLLVFDFASPAYGAAAFNEAFEISEQVLAPGTTAYFIGHLGAMKFTGGQWSADRVNYLDYPGHEPGGQAFIERDTRRFYPRVRFYRAIAHDPATDPFYALADSQRQVVDVEEELRTSVSRVQQLKDQINLRDVSIRDLQTKVESLKQQLNPPKPLQRDPDESTSTGWSAAWSVAAVLAFGLVLVAWQWRAIQGQLRRTAELHKQELQRVREEQLRRVEEEERRLLVSQQAFAQEFREKQATLEVEREKQKNEQAEMARSLLTSAICVPDVPDTDPTSETA